MCWRHFGRWRRQGDPLATGQHGGRRDEQQEAPDPGPLLVLRLELERARSHDCSFTVAWTTAIAVATDGLPERLRDEWAAVLEAHRAVWRAAYCRDPEGRPFELAPPEETWRPHARTAPPLVLSGARHDAPGTLEPVEVPWCN